jgi:acyl-coenzyme A synthetase/AMP-(fatty) acid ligase
VRPKRIRLKDHANVALGRGHIDASGRLWVEGRLVHIIHTGGGAVTPVPIERIVNTWPKSRLLEWANR